MNWTTTKPGMTEECVFVAAIKHRDWWSYEVYQIRWCDDPEDDEVVPQYLVISADGQYQWDNLDSINADKYLILPKHD